MTVRVGKLEDFIYIVCYLDYGRRITSSDVTFLKCVAQCRESVRLGIGIDAINNAINKLV